MVDGECREQRSSARAEMTYWEYEEAVRRFQGLLVRLGVEDALRKAGAQSGDTVRIGEYEMEWLD